MIPRELTHGQLGIYGAPANYLHVYIMVGWFGGRVRVHFKFRVSVGVSASIPQILAASSEPTADRHIVLKYG